MTKVVLVYPPFCTPASPPYSITALQAFLAANCHETIEVLDLNMAFHAIQFPTYQAYYQDSARWIDYDARTKEYRKLTSATYSTNNRRVVNDEKPALLDMLCDLIRTRKPDIVAFSVVYSSQAFFCYALIKALGIRCVVGGPCVNSKLRSIADKALANELELLEYITGKPATDPLCDTIPDFSQYELNRYFTPAPVIPIKTSTTCYYQQCAFCSHHSKMPYLEYPLETVRRTVIASGQKHFFLIDDMIPAQRLLAIARMMKPLDVKWTCQLRPTAAFDLSTLKTLRESGLRVIMWGVESGNDRVLSLMCKGTNTQDIATVLQDSHLAGIKNIVYTIVGFPSETKAEFLETKEFLKNNAENIDLVSLSVFGLQKGTAVHNDPTRFGIISMTEEDRTILDAKIRYAVSAGLSQEEAATLRRRHIRAIERINKYPSAMNFFREHLLCLA